MVASLTAALVAGLPSAKAFQAAAPHESRISVGKTSLYSREIGQGQPVIVLHGGPDFDHGYLLPDLDRLADSFRLIYYDQRGRGRSADQVLPQEVTIASEMDDLDMVRQHFDLASPMRSDSGRAGRAEDTRAAADGETREDQFGPVQPGIGRGRRALRRTCPVAGTCGRPACVRRRRHVAPNGGYRPRGCQHACPSRCAPPPARSGEPRVRAERPAGHVWQTAIPPAPLPMPVKPSTPPQPAVAR